MLSRLAGEEYSVSPSHLFTQCDSIAVKELLRYHICDPHTRMGRRLQWCDTAFDALMRPFEHEHQMRRYRGIVQHHQQREPLAWPS